MIKSSKHRIDRITNRVKLDSLSSMFESYKNDLLIYINYIIDGYLPLRINLSSKELPIETIKHSRYRQLIYKQASEIIRSQIKKANNKRYYHYKKVYKYFIDKHPNSKFVKVKYKELNLKDIYKTKYFTVPNLNNLSINLDERFFDITEGNSFDNFVRIKLPFFNDKGTRALQIRIPLKQHKHSNKLKLNGFKLRNNIQLKKINNQYYINLIWEKVVPLRTEGNSIGIDIGYKKLIAVSTGEILGEEMKDIYIKLSNKQRGSRNYEQQLQHKQNSINYYVNQLELNDIKTVIIEDLKNVKHKSKFSRKFNNKLQYWTYNQVLNKITTKCEENGVKAVKVSPAYTSQTCSCCGVIDKKSRKGEIFKCTSCGYEIDADINAAINIHSRGMYSSSNKEKVEKSINNNIYQFKT